MKKTKNFKTWIFLYYKLCFSPHFPLLCFVYCNIAFMWETRRNSSSEVFICIYTCVSFPRAGGVHAFSSDHVHVKAFTLMSSQG